ncbi:hypothetical protein [Serratia quinivorans]|uniref:hypothetical protein n=1 Tax=Serratia quinivorans TaxID=137545 RepID=UPI003F6FDDE4
MDKQTGQPKFPDLPIEVQVALINAASNMAATKIAALGKFNNDYDFFDREYRRICESLYKENRGR